VNAAEEHLRALHRAARHPARTDRLAAHRPGRGGPSDPR
jgi:hypothetical protein